MSNADNNIENFTLESSQETNFNHQIQLEENIDKLLYDELYKNYNEQCDTNREILKTQSILEAEIAQLQMDQMVKQNMSDPKNEFTKQIQILTDSLEKYKNKLTEKNMNIERLIEEQNRSDQQNQILKHKYNFVKNEYDRLTDELFNVKIYNNDNKSLLEQNNILLDANTKLTNDLYDEKKVSQILTQKLKFVNIEHSVLSEYHDKYKKDTEQKIYNLKLNFGLINVDLDADLDVKEPASNKETTKSEKDKKYCVEREEENDKDDEDCTDDDDEFVTVGKQRCIKVGSKYYKFTNGKRGKLHANENPNGTVSLVK
jgi:hypothetical protein